MKIKDILCPVCKPKYMKEMQRRGKQGMINRWGETKEKIAKEAKKNIKVTSIKNMINR